MEEKVNRLGHVPHGVVIVVVVKKEIKIEFQKPQRSIITSTYKPRKFMEDKMRDGERKRMRKVSETSWRGERKSVGNIEQGNGRRKKDLSDPGRTGSKPEAQHVSPRSKTVGPVARCRSRQ